MASVLVQTRNRKIKTNETHLNNILLNEYLTSKLEIRSKQKKHLIL